MATLKQSLVFLLKWTLVGLALACAILVARSMMAGPRPAHDPRHADVPGLHSEATVAPAPRRSFADAVARAAPAVVNIHTARVVSTSIAPGRAGPMYEQNLPAVRRRSKAASAPASSWTRRGTSSPICT